MYAKTRLRPLAGYTTIPDEFVTPGAFVMDLLTDEQRALYKQKLKEYEELQEKERIQMDMQDEERQIKKVEYLINTLMEQPILGKLITDIMNKTRSKKEELFHTLLPTFVQQFPKETSEEVCERVNDLALVAIRFIKGELPVYPDAPAGPSIREQLIPGLHDDYEYAIRTDIFGVCSPELPATYNFDSQQFNLANLYNGLQFVEARQVIEIDGVRVREMSYK